MDMSLASFAEYNIPFVVGYTFCFGLMGSLVVQAYIYFTRFPDDRKAIRNFVIIILVLETILTVMTFAMFCLGAIAYGILGAGMIAFIASWGLGPITGLVTTMTHGFYCWRIASLQKSYWIPILVMMVSLLQLGSITYLSIIDGLFPSSTTLNESNFAYQYSLSPWLVTWLGSSAVCDITITICMMVCLRPSRSHFEGNKSVLVKLTKLTIETGLVTAIAALLELFLGVYFKETWYHIAFFFAISKLYANCLLATLNFRLVLKDRSELEVKSIVWADGSDMRGTPSDP